MSAPKRIWAFDYDLQDETGDWETWQTWTEELPSPFQATEYRRADLPSTDAEVMAHPKVKALVEASGRLLHSVCSDTGFAACVRQDSGLAYPWEPMDEAEAELRAAIAAIQEAKT